MSFPPIHHLDDSIMSPPMRSEHEFQFLDACADGNLEAAKRFIQRWEGDEPLPLRAAMRRACTHGHVHIVEWLMAFNWELRQCPSEWFAFACSGGQLALAQKLHSLGGVDIHDGGVDIHDADDYAFETASQDPRAHHVARWLVSLDPDWAWWDVGLWSIRRWSGPRDAWMRSVVCIAGSVHE